MADYYRQRWGTHVSFTLRIDRPIARFSLIVCVLMAVGVPGPNGAFSLQRAFADNAASTTTLAPYVSALRIAIRDPLVQLTWQNPPGINGPVRIYRSKVEIDNTTLTQATLAGITDAGAESFLDIPPEPGEYYYAVLIQKPDNSVYDVFVPFRNITTRPIRISEAPTQAELAATVSGITTTRINDEVVLRFQSSRSGRTLVIFRSTSPIDSSDALSRAVRVREVPSDTSSVTDFPVPGIGYYYAVLDTALLTSGTIALKAGENFTGSAIEVPLGGEATGIPTASLIPRQTTPLPFLILQEGIQSGSNLVPSLILPTPNATLDPKTATAAEWLLSHVRIEAPAPLKPVVLNEDKVSSDKGAEYTLKGIVLTQLAHHQWSDAVTLLSNLLTLPLPADIRARAQFYLGQSYYFEGKYKQAFLAFLLSKDFYYTAAEPWMNAILDGRTD